MNDEEKALVLDLWDRDELTDTAARELLGDDEFEDARAKMRGTEVLLSGDTSRFLSDKADTYRRWRRGEISDEDAKEVFEDNFERVQQMAHNDEIVERTPDPDPDDDGLFFNDKMGDRD